MIRTHAIFQNFINEDFVLGEDLFTDVEVDHTQTSNFWYFKNIKKGLIKRFVLERTKQIEKICKVTLIKKADGKFTPRFDFEIWNITKKACVEFSKTEVNQNLIKAKVNLDSCYENFLSLINFIKGISLIDFESSGYAVIDKEKKDIFDNISKDFAVESFVKKYGKEVSEKDIYVLQNRRSKLEDFDNLLKDASLLESKRKELEIKTKAQKSEEDVWQDFFENNTWIFGYGLSYIWCNNLDEKN